MKSVALNSLTMSGRQSLLVCLAAALMLITFVTLQKFSVVPVSSSAPRLQELPLQIGTWQGTEKHFEQEVVTTLRTDDWMLRLYKQGPDTFVWLYVGYYADLLGFSNYHSPEACYPAQGWKLMQNDFQQIDIPGRKPILVQKIYRPRINIKRALLTTGRVVATIAAAIL